jgi:hypothetical protein
VLVQLKNNDPIADTTTNRFSIRRVMATCEGTITGAAFTSGTAKPDQTIVFAALGLTVMVFGYRIRKYFF